MPERAPAVAIERRLEADMSFEQRHRYAERRAERESAIKDFKVRNSVKRCHDLAEELLKSAPYVEKKGASKESAAEGAAGM